MQSMYQSRRKSEYSSSRQLTSSAIINQYLECNCAHFKFSDLSNNKNETFQNYWRFELGKQKSVLKIIPSKASVRKCAEIADYNNEEIIGRQKYVRTCIFMNNNQIG